MLLSLKIILFIDFTTLLGDAFAEPVKIPKNIFGTRKATNEICSTGPRNVKNEIVWLDCAFKTDTLGISCDVEKKIANDALVNARLELDFTN